MEQNNYEVRITCTNCYQGSAFGEKESTVEIPKGTKILDYLKDIPCQKCGCLTLVELK